ncbi:signal transduction histidine kinase [Deinococcus metalli]|uniref:histidine kinase n=1 Tax=Deinococcus metalli TaxID=1141878 RepID=A0A7W8NTP8_9DEIO|nr:ATP-binding protein [Deinococcus metalli]MBB5378427.1 signal transduction histidine kinase [Deinococcus metalli]GHF59053.1 two-component sensor histidine kinase [Deinococcus metalli]
MRFPLTLRARLVLAFALVSVPALLLLSAVTFGYVQRAYVNIKAQEVVSQVMNNVQAHYRANGTLAGLHPQEIPVAPAGAPVQMGHPDSPPPYLVLDPQRRVVVGVTGYPAGTVLDGAVQPILVDGQTIAYLYATGTPPTLDAQSRALLTRSGWLLAGLVTAVAGLAVLSGALLARRFLAPLGVLQDGVHRLTLGQSPRLHGAMPDGEWGELFRAFGAMTAELERRRIADRQFGADIAHELGTPLAVLRGTVEAMQDGTLPATPERLGRLQIQLSHLLHLSGDLRLLWLADAGDLRLNCENVTVTALLTDVQDAFRSAASERGVILDGPAVILPTALLDPVRITQVLHNLVQNALNHTPSGGRVTLTADQPAPGTLRIVVRDTGRGMAPEQLERVFDRLYRADDSRAAPGSGLGLSIARSLVAAHGGTLTLSSAPGAGTEATVTLPLSSTGDHL